MIVETVGSAIEEGPFDSILVDGKGCRGAKGASGRLWTGRRPGWFESVMGEDRMWRFELPGRMGAEAPRL